MMKSFGLSKYVFGDRINIDRQGLSVSKDTSTLIPMMQPNGSDEMGNCDRVIHTLFEVDTRVEN